MKLTIYVCGEMHPDNFLIVPEPAYEQTPESRQEIEVYCKCGRPLQVVRSGEALQRYDATEIWVADSVIDSLRQAATEPLVL